MIPRYSTEEMNEIWNEKNKLQIWLEVEIRIVEGWEQLGEIPKGTADAIRTKAKFNIDRMKQIEKVTRHDVVAFVENVREYLGDKGKYLHLGVTSSDIIDTAMAIMLKKSAEIIIKDICNLMGVLKEKAYKYKYTKMIGRSHGIHGEPVTFGLVLSLWYEEMKRNFNRMLFAKDDISYGKISGSMGTFANVPPQIEEYVCKSLLLNPAPVSNQIIQRDRYAHYLSVLAIIASSIEKIALEIRHLQRTEVKEIEEFFYSGQKGSSSMPHKRNPVLSENLCGLSRLVKSYVLVSLDNIALWHERDISHSSNERIILPDANILVDFMLKRITNILSNLIVYEDNMKKNIYFTKGLIFSQRVMIELVKKGINKETAYEIVQDCAMKAYKQDIDFETLLMKDERLEKILTKEEIKRCFDISYYTRYVDIIFRRVFKTFDNEEKKL